MGVETAAAKVGGWSDIAGKAAAATVAPVVPAFPITAAAAEETENGWVPESWFQGIINGTVTVKHPSLDVEGLEIWASLEWSTRGAGFMTLSATLEYQNEYLALEMHMVVGIKGCPPGRAAHSSTSYRNLSRFCH
jgi:hypothetical protein